MANPNQPKVVPLPLLKAGSIEDTLTGFAAQLAGDGQIGRRTEHATSVIVAEIRGWNGVRDGLGSERAGTMLQQTVERVLTAVEGLGADEVSLGGDATQPVLTISFDDDNHALRAVVAAQAVREAAAQPLHPSAEERFQAAVGVNTGVVIDTRVKGAGIEFSTSGTTRMFAVRLQEFAGPDQVFLSEATYQAVPTHLEVVPIGAVRTNGDGQKQQAYLLRGLLSEAAPQPSR
jgi:class 3 adenylate cyclase